MARRPTKGYEPKQTKISPQDVRDASTPEGTAQINEEFRRLRLAAEAQEKAIEEVAASTPQPESPKRGGAAEAEGGVDVLNNSRLILADTTELNFLDSPTAKINVVRRSGTRVDILVNANDAAALRVRWGRSKVSGVDSTAYEVYTLDFFDAIPNRRMRSKAPQEVLKNRSDLPVGFHAEPGGNKMVLVAYAKHNNLSVGVDTSYSRGGYEGRSILSTNVMSFVTDNHGGWEISPIEDVEVGDRYSRDGVSLRYNPRCSTTRWDTPKWDNSNIAKTLYPLVDPYSVSANPGDAEIVVFTSQNIEPPHGEVEQAAGYWRFRAHYDRGSYRVHALVAVDDDLWQNWPLVNPFLMLFKNGQFYSVLDYSPIPWHIYMMNQTWINQATYVFAQLSPGESSGYNPDTLLYEDGTPGMPMVLRGTDIIDLECGDYLEIRFALGVAPMVPAAFTTRAYDTKDVVFRYGYVGVNYTDSCGCPDQEPMSGFTHQYA